MEQIYKSLRSLITDEMTSVIAGRLNANETNVSQAISSMLAGFLVLTRRKGDTLQIRNIFDEAGSLNVLSRIDSVCGEALTPDMVSLGDNFLQHVLGDRAEDFTSWISLETGLNRVATNALIAMLTPVFVGYVGNKLIGNRWSMRKFLGVIDNQMNTYRKFAPSTMA